jgi:hypothetical protein
MTLQERPIFYAFLFTPGAFVPGPRGAPLLLSLGKTVTSSIFAWSNLDAMHTDYRYGLQG